MQITRNHIDTQKGPAEWFTGDVYIDAVAAPEATSTFAAAGGPLHARRAHRLAHPSARADDLRHRGRRALPARGRPDRGRSARATASSSSPDETPLARGRSQPLHGPHRHAAERRERQPGYLGRARDRRAVRRSARVLGDSSGSRVFVTGSTEGLGRARRRPSSTTATRSSSMPATGTTGGHPRPARPRRRGPSSGTRRPRAAARPRRQLNRHRGDGCGHPQRRRLGRTVTCSPSCGGPLPAHGAHRAPEAPGLPQQRNAHRRPRREAAWTGAAWRDAH